MLDHQEQQVCSSGFKVANRNDQHQFRKPYTITTTINQLEQQPKKRQTGRNMTSSIKTTSTTPLPLLLLLAATTITILVTTSTILINGVNAEHALSEVWSEGDGLQMKYLTNHDDLLSTKGSELSLATSQHKQKESTDGSAEQQVSSNGAEGSTGEGGSESNQQESSGPSSSSSAEGGSGESNTESSSDSSSSEPPAASAGGGESNGEGSSDGGEQNSELAGEGADSSRQSNLRVPMAASKTQKSMALVPKQSRFATAKPATSSNIDHDDDVDEGSSIGENSSSSSGKAKKQQYPSSYMSYNSALEQSEDGTGSAETANVDAGSDESAGLSAESVGPKFRPPGRLFKQAVKMVSDDGENGSGGSSSSSSNNNNDNSENAEADNDEAGNSSRKRQQQQVADQAEDSENPEANVGASADNGELSDSRDQPMKVNDNFRARQNMIDFDRVVDTNNNNNNNNNRQFLGNQQQQASGENFGDIPEVVSVDENGPENEQQGEGSSNQFQNPRPDYRATTGPLMANGFEAAASFRPPHGRPNAVSSHQPLGARSMVSGASIAHKDRLATGVVPANRHQQQQQPPNGAAQNRPPTGYKDLAYFRGVAQQHQHQLGRSSAAAAPAAIPQMQSPDNERDNFISPGHFPGSMPHLTQAASETRQAAAAPSGGGSDTDASSIKSSSSSSSSASSTGGGLDGISAASSTTQERLSAPVGAEFSPPTPAAAATATTSQPSDRVSTMEEVMNSTDDDRKVASATASTAEQLPPPQVTPEPESQPESQQIMAPLLMSTTTMAPMPATTNISTGSGGPQNDSGSTTISPKTASSSSTPPASLKRFKFRKYR